MRGEGVAADVYGRTRAALHGVANVAKGGRLAHPMTRGTLNRPASRLRIRRVGQRLLTIQATRAQRRRGRPRSRVRTLAVGGTPGGVDALHLVGVFENVAELARVELDFVVSSRRRCASAAIASIARGKIVAGIGKC